MDTRTREIVAIGAAVTANCVACLRFHLDKAWQAGASADEVEAAVDVGRMVRRGAASIWDKEAKVLLAAGTGDLAAAQAPSGR